MKTAKEILKEQEKIIGLPIPYMDRIIQAMEEYASQYNTNKVTDKGNELEFALNNYVKEKHTQEECIGFIDGFNKGLSLSTQEKQPEREPDGWVCNNVFVPLRSHFNDWQFDNAKPVYYTLPKQITEGKEAEG